MRQTLGKLGPFYKLQSDHANREIYDIAVHKMPHNGEHFLKFSNNSFYLKIEISP